MKPTLALIIGLMWATTAYGQPALCGSYDLITEKLKSEYHETRLGWGMNTPQDKVVELWGSDGSSWSIIARLPDGKTACFVFVGLQWHPEKEKDAL